MTPDATRSRMPHRRQTEWEEPIRRLPADTERFARGSENVDRCAVANQRVGELGAGADDVLAVVEDDQGGLVLEMVDESFEGGTRLSAVRGRVRSRPAFPHPRSR